MENTTKTIGDQGEAAAVFVLENNGYKIIEQNFRTRFGEIDVIAREGNNLVFVEVKKKTSNYFGTAAEMITASKLQKIKGTALTYISENSIDMPWRVDAVVIDGEITRIIKNITL